MKSYETRVATEADIAQITTIAVNAFPRGYADATDRTTTDRGFAEAWIGARLALFPFWVCVLAESPSGEIVGYNSWLVGGGRSGVVHSDQTAVREDSRNRGVGRALKYGSERILKDHLVKHLGVALTTLTCTCAASNTPMRRLLESTGYEFRASLGALYYGAEEVYYILTVDPEDS